MRGWFGIGVVAVSVALSVSSASSAADRIVRKSVKTPIDGEIKDISKTEVTIEKKAGGSEKIAAGDILSITWDGEPAGLNIARINETNGAFDKAVDAYRKGLEASASGSDGLKADLQWSIARVLGRQALGDPSKSDDAIKELEAFKSKHGSHYTFYDATRLLGELYLQKKDLVKAQTQFEQMGKAPTTDFQMASKIALGRLALADNKPEDALASFEAVIGMSASNPQEESQQLEAKLNKAKITLAKNEVDESLKLLEEVLAKCQADDSRLQAEAYLRQGDCFRVQNKEQDALLAYLHVDVLFSAEKTQHAEALFQLTKLFAKLGQPVRSAEHREKLEAEYPASDWAKQAKAG